MAKKITEQTAEESVNNRQSTRFSEMGKVIATELCSLAGILDNISLEGCKVHFPIPVVADLDSEYMLKITLSRNFDEPPLQLLCKPMWVSEENGTTQIGFSFLFSPDVARLRDFIYFLEQDNDDSIPGII
ncbi:MAG: PilZ domain-containing protein [Treponema sp.]|nr:PilZ domain-containing protein [Treponema sp.]